MSRCESVRTYEHSPPAINEKIVQIPEKSTNETFARIEEEHAAG